MGLEIRWFFQGPIPSAVDSWFQGQILRQFSTPAQKLTDVYLRNRDYNLGLKLRQGQLEIKWRRSYAGFAGVDGRVQGQAEDWTKWVWSATGGKMAPQVVDAMQYDPQGPWVPVAKERWQRKYIFRENEFFPARLDDSVERGCEVELVKVTVHGQGWWTLALDTFTRRGDATMILPQRVETLFSDYPGPALTLEYSYGYPQWLHLFS